MSHLIVELPTSVLEDCLLEPLEESIWKDSGIKDLQYRVDPARPEMNILQHVHIAHKKHTATTSKQVSWNSDASKHDRGRFDASFKGLKSAEAVARIALNLPEELALENKPIDYDGTLSMLLEKNLDDALLPSPEYILCGVLL